jgi:hypothetical protein
MNAKLSPVAGFRQALVSNVIFEIEMFVVDPVGKVEFQRHTDKAPAKYRIHMQASTDMLQNVFETNNLFPGYGCLIKYGNRRDVRQVVVRLHVQELRILTAQLVH